MTRCIRWFSSGTPVYSTNKTDNHDITEILLKVALNTITLTLYRVRVKIMNVSCHCQQYFSYIMVVSFISIGNRSTLRKLPPCHSQTLSHESCIQYTWPFEGFALTSYMVIGTDESVNTEIVTDTERKNLALSTSEKATAVWGQDFNILG